RIALDLPPEPVNVVKEDPANENILYIGTDQGLYISLDRGANSMMLGELPPVAVHDLAIHPRDHEIVVATHGRSFYKADVQHVQKMQETMPEALTCFDEIVRFNASSRWGTRNAVWADFNEPTVTYPVYSATEGEASLQVFRDSLMVHEEKVKLHKGLGYYDYHLEMDSTVAKPLTELIKQQDPKSEVTIEKRENEKYYLPEGKYKAIVILNGQSASWKLESRKRGG
ncbi:MAG TPA: hypothetical protein VJ508_17420, partial [Saprospiraceae bacterium]|nr:hypothetical protein [Saprospiraceae bacterium]